MLWPQGGPGSSVHRWAFAPAFLQLGALVPAAPGAAVPWCCLRRPCSVLPGCRGPWRACTFLRWRLHASVFFLQVREPIAHGCMDFAHRPGTAERADARHLGTLFLPVSNPAVPFLLSAGLEQLSARVADVKARLQERIAQLMRRQEEMLGAQVRFFAASCCFLVA